MYMIADTCIAPCYVYVHEEMHSSKRALELGEFTWLSLHAKLSLNNWLAFEVVRTWTTPCLRWSQR